MNLTLETTLRPPGFALRITGILACLVLLVGCGGGKSDAQPGNAGAVGRPVVKLVGVDPDGTEVVSAASKSAFSTALTDGRDPFFPDSKRRYPKAATATGIASSKAAAKVLPTSENLKLYGLYSAGKRPLALINRTPMAQGDEARVAVTVGNAPGGAELHKLLVRCLEVRSNSVVISVEGEPGTKELFLKSRL